MAYPTSVATDADLYLVKNQLSTVLNGSIDASVTTITVTSTTGFPTVGVITIDSEVVKYTGTTATQFTGCTRGFDSTGATTHSDGATVKHAVTAIHHNALKDELIAVETALGTNLTNVVQTTGTQSVAGAKTFTTQLIGKGTATNDSAATGYIGEYVSSNASTDDNVPATGVWADLTSISLTAGDWDVSMIVYVNQNSATWTSFQAGISDVSGNVEPSVDAIAQNGSNYTVDAWASSSTTPVGLTVVVPTLRITKAGTTTIYLKRRCTYSAGTPITRGYRLSARRVR